MDPRMNEYGGYQSSYQGCGMNQGMNGFDGYQSSSQYGGFGYDVQQYHCVDNQEAYADNQEANHQGSYTNNQEAYHHQQWSNIYQDPYSSSSQYQEPCSSSSQHQEPSSSSIKCLRLVNGRLVKIMEESEEDKRVLDGLDEMTESPIEEEIDKKDHLASHEDEDIIEEASAKGDSNEPTSKTLTKEKDIPKVKESLQALLESDDMGEFLSKVEHLKFILDNKDMLGEVLHKYEEEQCSNIHMRALFKEAPSMEKKETVRSEDVIQVENVVKTTEAVKYDPPLVVEQRETLQPLKQAKRKRRKKPNKTKGRGIEPKPPLLTFTPLRFIDGKLECKVSSKGRSKPFSRVKILLPPGSKEEDWSAINEAMVKAFSMKLGDRGPLYQSKFPIPPNG